MPLFKRRNAVKAKHGKNAPKESPIPEDEASVITEINSMLNDLVTVVSEKTDSELKNEAHANAFPINDVSNHSNSVQKKEACSNPVSTNIISQQTLQENDACSSSDSRNNVSAGKTTAQERDTHGATVQANDSITKQMDSTHIYGECTAKIQSNEISKQRNSIEENDMCMNPPTMKVDDVSKQTESTQKNDEHKNLAQIDCTSKESNVSQQSDECENHVTANDISDQIDDEDTNTLSTTNVSKVIDRVQGSDENINTLSMTNVSKETDRTEKNNELTKPLITTNDSSNAAKEEVDDSNVPNSVSSENDLEENIPAHEKKVALKKTRSSSESGSTIESYTKYVRRKYGSEAEIMSIVQKILPPEQQKGINEAVGKYIDNLIKESISQAVKSINVDNLCQELIKDVSNRKNSQSAESEEDFAVEQRLSSNSISELVELQNCGSKISEDQKDCLLSECDDRVSETESLEIEADETDRVSFGGYLADLEDTASIDDLKSFGEDSLNSSACSGLEDKLKSRNYNSECSDIADGLEYTEKTADNKISENITANVQTVVDDEPKLQENCPDMEITQKQHITAVSTVSIGESDELHLPAEKSDNPSQINPEKNVADKQEQKKLPSENFPENEEPFLSTENNHENSENFFMTENNDKTELKIMSTENSEISLQSLDEENLLMKNDFKMEENKSALIGALRDTSEEDRMKVNWKVGNLHVKLPHKSRGKTKLKAWKKRRVVIQPDEFANDPTNQSLVISVYASKKHETTFWYSVSSQKAVVFRSSSHTHRYAFTISEGGEAIIHLSAENESETQEWMAAIRAVLWPPSPFMELEKMLSGQEFEVSVVDNEFSYHAGLLGMYGYLSITPKKLILLHPQQGYVIQEWYLNTVDKFQFVLQPKAEDMHKVLCMTTCKDSSTGQGDIIFFCKEAVTLLQALASTIHQVLSYHSKQEGGKYQKELEELAEWMVAPPQDCLNVQEDEHYKVPPRQVKSLLDIPNFIFTKSLSPVASAIYPAPNTEVIEALDATKNKLINTSKDSGISTCTSGDDFLNCSTASFVIGGGPMTGKSSDSELSDTYSPPRTPDIVKKRVLPEVVNEEASVIQ